MKKVLTFLLTAVVIGYVVHLAFGYAAIRRLETESLIDAAIGYTEVPIYVFPLVVQRSLAAHSLANRDTAALRAEDGNPEVTLSLPLAIAHHKYDAVDGSRAKQRERARAQRLAKMLYDRGVKLEKLDLGGCTSLQAMALAGDEEFYDFLLDLGASPEDANEAALVSTCRIPAKEILTRRRQHSVIE